MILWLSASWAATLTLDGTCGNAVAVDVTGLTPGGTAAILSARGPGAEPIPVGPCAGELLGLDATWKLRKLERADAAGEVHLAPLLPAPATCGAHVQVVDAATCTTSGVAVVLAPPLEGFGQIRGECGVLDDGEWSAPDPFLFENAIDFGAEVFDPYLLTPEGLEVMLDGNLGGSSLESEAIAMEILARCEDAALLKTETEINYVDANGKKTDLLTRIDGLKVGVSVFRALTFVNPGNRCGTPGQALADNVEQKLSDILLSAANAAPEDAWERSALAVIACDQAHADFVQAVWAGLPPAVRDETLVLVSVTDGDDVFLYD